LGAGVGGICIFSPGAGPGEGDAYTRLHPHTPRTRFLKFTLLNFIILFP